jgi:hypothetical protein
MILRDIIKNYYDHKYITIFNIVFSIILSFFLYVNIERLTGRTAYMAILDFDKSFVIPPELKISETQYSFVQIEKVFNNNLTSYTNFKKWADLNKINVNESNYGDFISLKLLDKKIIISDANVNFKPGVIDLLKDYINFTVQKTNFEESKKLFFLLETARLELLCGEISNFLKMQSTILQSDAMNQTLDKYEKYCLGPLKTDSNNNNLSKLDTNFEEYYQNFSSEIKIYNFVKFSYFERQKVSINNLKVINLPSITIIILILSLLIQNLVITFYKRDQ